jgi:hypothetical protein
LDQLRSSAVPGENRATLNGSPAGAAVAAVVVTAAAVVVTAAAVVVSAAAVVASSSSPHAAAISAKAKNTANVFSKRLSLICPPRIMGLSALL